MTSDLSPRAPQIKVVVTGIGLTTGLGADRESSWNALREGRTAARWIGATESYVGCPFIGTIASNDEPVLGLLERVADEAMADAGLAPGGFDPDRAACLIGLSKGGIRSLSAACDRRGGTDERDATIARLWSQSWPGAGATLVARRHGLRGPSLAPVAACATGLVAVLQGADLIRRGACDLALAGSVDASLEPILLAAFRRMRVLAHVDGDPRSAVRPWDRRRSGFIVGEGGAVLILERDDHARARGTTPIVEIAGGALGSDAYHATDLNPDPAGLAHLIGLALSRSDTNASEIDHVNVHGTATRVNDPLECRALRRALGRDADRVACSANKAQIGHLLGAAGSAELAIACLAIRDGFVPPTLNLDDPDPACDLDATPHVGRPRPIRAALKLSIGFGGHLAAAVLRLPEGRRHG
jgi:3-oxoacyl-[acyl-carrier-protein] synthase II